MKATINGIEYKQVRARIGENCFDCDIYKDTNEFFPACQYFTLNGNTPQDGITRNGQPPKVIADFCADDLTKIWKRKNAV